MGSLTAPILAALPAATTFAPIVLTMLTATTLAVGMMGLLVLVLILVLVVFLVVTRHNGYQDGPLAKQPADLVPARVLIALHEPPLRSMTGRRAAAPSRAPPSCHHLDRLTVPRSRHLGGRLEYLSERLDLAALCRV